MTAKNPAGEKNPVIPAHEVKVLQLFVCYSSKSGGFSNSKYDSPPRDHWVGEETDADNKTSF